MQIQLLKELRNLAFAHLFLLFLQLCLEVVFLLVVLLV